MSTELQRVISSEGKRKNLTSGKFDWSNMRYVKAREIYHNLGEQINFSYKKKKNFFLIWI